MKIIFVGMHNKPNKEPLCSSTKSGKLIDRIIKKVKPIRYLKTNLYNTEYYPPENSKERLAQDWINRYNPQPDDIIVLLGAEVHKHYIERLKIKNVIKIPHPASQRSHVDMKAYVTRAVKQIKFFQKEDKKMKNAAAIFHPAKPKPALNVFFLDEQQFKKFIEFIAGLKNDEKQKSKKIKWKH